MKKTGLKTKAGKVITAILAAMILMLPMAAMAGTLDPGAGPDSTMHSLGEIYDKLETMDTKLDSGSCDTAPVPKTGQTKCYNTAGAEITCTGTGQDGDLLTGVTWPTPRFTDNGNGTVKDNLTGLIWLTNANCPAAGRNWQTALDDVVQFNTDGTMNSNDCGDTSNSGSHKTDWRLPNLFELESLRDMAYFDPALSNTQGTAQWTEGNPFNGVQSSYYWSSTTHATNTSSAWIVNMKSGSVGIYGKTSSSYVWLVRSDN